MSPLRVPVRISDSYVSPGDESHIFPEVCNYLTRDELLGIFPSGVLNNEVFLHESFRWRLIKRSPGGGGGSAVYIAMLDGGEQQQQQQPHRGGSVGSSSLAGPDTPSISPANSAGSSLTEVPTPSVASRISVTANEVSTVVQRRQRQLAQPSTIAAVTTPPSPGGHNAVSLLRTSTDRTSIAFPALSMVHMHNPQERTKFIEDLLLASDSPNPMERYKALIRLMSSLRRSNHGTASKLAAALGSARGGRLDAWDCGPIPAEVEDLLRHVVMVGECLARFGTADFAERSNSSRAITSRDYATLLTQFLEYHGAAFSYEFIERLPQNLQDEALGVRSLLQTRCDANKLIFEQLIRAVGMENQTQAVVFNNTTANSNPVNYATASPQSAVTTTAGAMADASVEMPPPPRRRSLPEMAAMAGLALIGALVLKRGLSGGGGRRHSRRAGWDDSDGEDTRHRRRHYGNGADYAVDGRGGRRGGLWGGGGRAAEGPAAERLAMRYLTACREELAKAQFNTELLKHDWRFGQVRLSDPAGPAFPPGYKPVDASYCCIHNFLDGIEGSGLPPLLQQQLQHQQHQYGGGWGAAAVASLPMTPRRLAGVPAVAPGSAGGSF